MTVEVFISYAHEDRRWREKLEKHLSSLKKQQFIHAYYDGDISPGKKIEDETLLHLKSAQMILLLVSSNYMAADFCYQDELQEAIERDTAKQARVIPIFLSPVECGNAPFAELESLPSNHKPISKWRGREDDAFFDIVQGIKRALVDLEKNTPASSSVAAPIPTVPIEPATVIAEEPKPIFHVPFQRNPYFTGREEILTQLHQNFSDTRKVIQPQAIRGLGGMGKTQLAIEYAYRFRAEYRYVFWVKANSHDLLVADYVNIANLLNLTLRENTDQMLIVAVVKEWLRAHENWLLILDNVEDIAVIKKTFLPSGENGHVLLTTRIPIVGTTIQQRELTSMSLEEGVLCLLRRAKFLDVEAPLDVANEWDRYKAAEIVEMLGALPLALAQAGAYIEEKECGLVGYIERYQKHRKKLLEKQGEVDHEPVAATWSLSFEEIECDNAAADLLRFCAFLHPDAIPEKLIADGAEALSAPLQAIAKDEIELDEAVDKLKKYSLVRRNDDGKTLNIHRLVQAVLQDNMDQKTQQLWAERTVRAVNLAFPEPSVQTRQWCQQLLPHAQVCATLIKQWSMESPEALHLLELAGQYLHEYGQYQDAESFMLQLLALQEYLYGKDHLDIARTLNTLGEIARLQGHYQQAQILCQRALSVREQFLEPQHPDIATSLNGLARSYHHFAQYPQAAELYEKALAIREQVLGPQNPDVAHSLNDLAVLYGEQGRYQEELPLYQRALEIRRQMLGLQHRDTAMSLSNLAGFYKQQGSYQEALPLFQQALGIRGQVLGQEHPDTADSLSKLADLYEIQGKYEKAEPLYVRALAICERQLGTEHPDTASSLNNLAALYQEQGKYGEAEPLYVRALAISERQLGGEHPDTASSLNNLAALYQEQGKYGEAEPLYVRALAIRERQLGGEHPDTANSLNNLAELYRSQGKYGGAEPLYVRALAIRERQLGGEHPSTASSLNNLALLYRNQGKYGEALSLYQRALAICEKTLGPQHPDTAKSLGNLAELYRVQEKMVQAITYAKRSLTIHEKVLGAKHPDVAVTLSILAIIYTNQNNFKQADPLFQRALSICMQSLGPEHPTTLKIVINYAHMLRKARRNTKAEEMEARAEAIRVKLRQEPLQTEQEG